MFEVEGMLLELLTSSKSAQLQLSAYKTVRVVLGNQTCDLDSAVCTLIQGYVEYTEAKQLGQQLIAIIPVLNIPQKEFRIKTEVNYLFKTFNIPLNLLTFRDQINLHDIWKTDPKRLELILVDHHALPDEDIILKPAVKLIIDHRPKNSFCTWPNHILRLEQVGSCATLIARYILQKCPHIMDAQIASLLRGAILIDTCNVSEHVGIAKSFDIEIVSSLEHFCGHLFDRKEMFREMVNAKMDISKLTFDEILHKDLKIVGGIIPIVVICCLIENFFAREGVKEAIEKFSDIENYNIIVLIGTELKEDQLFRDIAIFSKSSNELKNKLIQALVSCEEPYLSLTLIRNIQDPEYNFCLYQIESSKITRKQILPIVEKTVMLYESEQQ